MGDKQLVSTSTVVETTATTLPNGQYQKKIVTTTVEKYADGSTSTKRKTETIIDPSGSNKGGKGPTVASPEGEDPTAATDPKVPVETPSEFIQEALKEHNLLRGKHGAAPLTINDELCKISQAWANKLAKKGKMAHSQTKFGENIYWNTEPITGDIAVKNWYSEIKDYNFDKLEGQKGTGHFTQVIWKSTKELGIALAKGRTGNYVVANYNPPGNFIGRYPENIQK